MRNLCIAHHSTHNATPAIKDTIKSVIRDELTDDVHSFGQQALLHYANGRPSVLLPSVWTSAALTAGLFVTHRASPNHDPVRPSAIWPVVTP